MGVSLRLGFLLRTSMAQNGAVLEVHSHSLRHHKLALADEGLLFGADAFYLVREILSGRKVRSGCLQERIVLLGQKRRSFAFFFGFFRLLVAGGN